MPIYNLNNRVYDIPDDVVKEFEKDNPTATMAYQDGEDIYDIQVNQKEEFLKQFPKAKLYVEQPVSMGTQEEDNALFEANMERLKNGQPIERVTTQSLLDASKDENGIPDSELKRLKDIHDNAQKQIDESSFFDRFFNENTRTAVATRNEAEEALELYEEANREKENWFDRNVVGVMKGFADKFGDLSTWDFGASGLASAKALNDISTKLEAGEPLSAAEQNMLDAYGLASAVQSAYQDKVGLAYRVGGSLPESMAFGASLAINPAGGVGKKLAETAAKAAVKKYGTTLASKLAKGAARVGGDVLEMGVATAVPGGLRVAEDYYNRLNGQSTFDIDDNGIIRYGGQADQEEADNAIWKSFGSQFIENYSEAMGNYFAPMGNMISGLTSKGLKAAHLGKFADLVSDISSSQFSKGLQRFKQATKFDGLVGEYLEEVAGNVINAATVGDMNFNSPEDPRSVFNPETNIETFLSCALLSGTMYAVEAPVSIYNKNVAKRNLNKADNAAKELWGDRWDDMRSQMDEADPQLLAQLLTGVQNANDLSDEQKQAAKDYGMRLMQYQGYNARRLQNEAESTSEANEINNAYDEGSDLQTPYDKHSAKRAADKAEAALGNDAEFVKAVMDGASSPVATINAMAESGKYTEEQIQEAKDYYSAMNRMNGMTDALLDEVDSQIESANVEVDMNTNKNTGVVTKVVLRGGELGYVIEGSVVGGENGKIDANGSDDLVVVRLEGGEVKMMNPNKDLAGVAWTESPEKLKNENNTVLRQSLIDKGIQEIDWNPATPNPKVGDSFEMDGISVTIVSHDGNGGMFVVPSEEWQAAQGNEKKQQELISKAQQMGVVQAGVFKQWVSDQLDAQEEAAALQEEAAIEVAAEEAQAVEEAAPVEEVEQPQAQVEPQAPVIPTKEDGSIDFVSYGKESTFKTLGEKYGEKMPNKVAVTAKAFADDLKKAQNEIDKAQDALDNAPIGRDSKQQAALDKAKVDYEAVKREADFWAEMDADIKAAQAQRESILNPQAEINVSQEPITADEFIAQQIGNGSITLVSDSYKKETGYGEEERKKFIKMFRKAENGGLTIEEAGELLMQIDRENGTNFFNQEDANAGRDAIINFLGSVRSWGDITGYIKNNRRLMAEKESENLRNEFEDYLMNNFHMTPEEYATALEMEMQNNPYEGVDVAAIDAIFAEAEEQLINEQKYGSEGNVDGNSGESELLSQEQVGESVGDNASPTNEQAEGVGGRIKAEGETSQTIQSSEVANPQIADVFAAAEQIDAEEKRRIPLRKRANEWAKALGVKVTFIERIEDVDARTRAQIESSRSKGDAVPGWVAKNGEVFFFMPDLRNINDVNDTYVHEVVAHKGLKEMLGIERFNELCDKVWEMMPTAERVKYMAYPGVKNHRDAADEYMAFLSEEQNLTPEQESIWDKIVQFFRELFDQKLNGILAKSKLTNEDISNLIKASYANLKSGKAEGGVGSEGKRFRAIDEINEAYNKRLIELDNERGQKDRVLRLGRPSVFLKDGGIVDADIEMEFDKFVRKSDKDYKNDHPFVASDIMDLPKAIHSPIAVFNSKNLKDKVILTELNKDGNNFIVAIKAVQRRRKGGIVLEVNEIATLYPKNAKGIVDWFNKGLASNIDIEKALRWLEALRTHHGTGLSNEELNDATNVVNTFDKSNLFERNNRLRVVKDAKGNASLVGLHNISEEKLKKAIKQGGLANPSMAVIDMDKQSHVDYGDITLVAPAELIDKNTGRSAGTYMGDAWTPVYPKVTLQLDNKGWKKINQYIESIVEDRELQNNMKYGAEMYMEGENGMYMNFAFLKAKGLNPEIFYKNNDGYISTDDIKKLLGVEEIDTSFEGYSKLKEHPEETLEELKLWARTYGNKAKIDSHKKRLKEIKNQYGEDSKAYKLMTKPSDELGYGEFDRLVVETKRKERDNGKIDSYKTFNEANYYVAQNGLRQEFENWMDELLLDAGAKEVFFAGYTPSGNKRYMANTIENVSKFMNKQSKTNAYDETGFGATKALFLKKLNTLEEIREQKGKLVELEEYRETTQELSDRMGDLISRLSDMQTISSNKFMNYDYAASRLQEAMTKRNPIKYLNDEYGYGLDKKGSFAEDLSELINDIKDSPARYFETKFERPVYLNEFAAAVVPQGTSKDVVDALTEAGLPVEEYEKNNNEARMAAVDKVASETDGIRFRFIGAKGAANMDKAEEATTRLDNLAVAREMEAADKDAKAIKLATGWERGADGLWRYEVPDNLNFDYYANVDYKKRHPELARFDDLRKKLNSSLLMETEALTEEEQKEYDALEKEFGGYKEYHRSRKLKDYIDAPELFDAYPKLRNVELLFIEMERETLGEYLPGENTIVLNSNMKLSGRGFIEQVLAHEIQHAIQHIEGFEQGANKNMQDPNKVAQKAHNREFMQSQLDKHIAERDELLKQKDALNDKMSAWYDSHEEDAEFDDKMNEYNRQYDEIESQLEIADRKVAWDEKWLDATKKAKTELGEEGYAKVAGEVEARNVTSRMKMSDFDRRNTLASETEDVAREDQIFLNESIGLGETRFRVKFSEEEQSIIDIAKADGTYMKAPNGQPTKLTEKQWAQVRTKAFKKWFGDWENDPKNASKVVDANGEPLVVYHSSHEEWSEFDTERGYIWAWRDNERPGSSSEFGMREYSLFMNLRNPFVFDADYQDESDIDFSDWDGSEHDSAAGIVSWAESQNSYDGVIIKNVKEFADRIEGEDYVAFEPNQIKSATDNVGTFDEGNNDIRFRIANRNQEIFVSNAQKAVEGIKQEKATPQQWLAMVEKNGGLKAGEDKWLGLSDWLKESTAKTLTKDEVLNFINQNKIVIEEVTYGDWDNLDKRINSIRRDYTTQGLTNKQEIALTVPTIDPWNVDDEIHFGDAGEGRAIAWIRFGETTIEDKELAEKSRILGTKEWWSMSEEERNAIKDELKELKQNSNPTRVLVIDEIQSKRHQEGREKGYKEIREFELGDWVTTNKAGHQTMRMEVPVAEVKVKGTNEVVAHVVHDTRSNMYHVVTENNTSAPYSSIEKVMEVVSLKLNKRGGVPQAPFEKNWSELAMKRMLRYAAENGFDKVAWTKGEQQAERYNLSKVVDSIECNRVGKNGNKSFVLRGLDYNMVSNNEGVVVAGTEEFKGKQLSEIVGTSLAEKMLGMEEGDVIDNTDLRFGGEGMKAFYDKMLPSFVNKYVKKWGTKVQNIELPDLEEAGQIMHSVDVTDAMKESVMEGQVMFRISPKGKQVQEEVDKFTSKYASKPVTIVDSEMTDEELEEAYPTSLAEDTRKKISEGKKGGYSPTSGKIHIFVDNVEMDEVENSLFHENLHKLFEGNPVINEFFERFDEERPEVAEEFRLSYDEADVPEETFVFLMSQGMVLGKLGLVNKYLSEQSKSEFFNKIKEFGYDYEQESARRNRRSNTGSDEDSKEVRSSGSGVQEVGEGTAKEAKPSPRERAERLKEFFDKVADMGLDGVLGNKRYGKLLMDIYNIMPDSVRKQVNEWAIIHYGGDFVPAMSDYLNKKATANIWHKVVAFVRETLRKAGFDLDLNSNDVKYMLWRSQKPMKRYMVLDVAEDIDARRKFGVDGDSGVRFRVKNNSPFDPSDKRSKIVQEYDKFLKTGKFNFIEAFQDRMYSVKVLMDMIVDATGKKVRDFEDAYTAENQLGSINKPAEEKYLKNFYKPLVEAVKALSEKYGRDAVERYIYCKSGIERNEVLRQRDADEAYNDAKAELDEKLANNQIDQAQYNALLQQADDQRLKTLSEDVDYSGIRGMLYNIKAQAINKEFEEGKIDKSTRDARLANLEANRKTVVKDWKKFAEDQVSAVENAANPAELKDLWKKINAATNETLRMDYESGMIDKDTYNAEKNMMKYYIPLRNWSDTTAEEMYEYRSELVRPVSSNQKRAKGRESQADNPIATIALMAQNAIVRGNRNKVKQKFYAFVSNRETGLASVRDVWYVRDPNGDWVPQYADTTHAKDAAEFAQILDDFETNMQTLQAQGDAYKGRLPFGMKFRANRQQKQSHVVPVMINGKEYAVYVNGNPRPAQAMNGETNSEASNSSAWYDKIKRIYGAGLTSWNPDFIIPNMIRDGIHASTMTFLDAGPIAAAKFAFNGPRAFAQVFAMISGKGKSFVDPKNQAYFEEFVANGGETGYTAIHTLEDYKKEYDKLMDEVKGLNGRNFMKKGFEGMAKWLEAANRIFEDVNRFNAYVSARESGESIMRSINAAKNITVNFNKKGALSANNTTFGTVANFMSKWILFFNPAVQGIEQLITKSKANKGRAITIASTILASGFFMPMLNEMLVAAGGDDEEDDYWNQSDYKRRNNWLIFTGSGYVSIPLPPVLRELYGIGDIIYGSITGHITPERAAMDFARQVQSAVGFINLIPEVSQEPDMVTWAKGFAPDIAAPVLDVISNTNFMGRPIAKWTDFNEYEPEYERVYKGVSPQWVELSKLLNRVGGQEGRRSDFLGNFINPAMMEHLVTSYGGGIGKTINNLAGMAADLIKDDIENIDPYRKSPILPRFYTPNDEKTVVPAINRKYYDYDYMYNVAKKALKNYQEGVRSKEHPEYQKYIDGMKENGELEFIRFFENENKRLKRIQNLIKGEPTNKEDLEKRMIDIKAEIAAKCYEMLN